MRVRKAVPPLVLALVGLCALSTSAAGKCPESGSPSRAVCEYWNAILMPSAALSLYLPGEAGAGPWFGGGIQLGLYTWSDNNARSGRSQGRLFFDFDLMRSSADDTGTMLLFRTGAALSFEGNAARTWLIPYGSAAIGGLHEPSLGFHCLVEALVGVHALYTPTLIISAQGGYLVPFSDFDTLAGPRLQLTVSFAWW